MSNKKWMSIPEYAKHADHVPRYIHDLIKAGKIPKSAIRPKGARKQVHVDRADKALSENISIQHQMRFKKRATEPPGPTPEQAAALIYQEKAAAYASEPEEDGPGLTLPFCIWLQRYIGCLAEINPEAVTWAEHGKSHWTVYVQEFGEDGEDCSWEIEIKRSISDNESD